jgi:hypothetical protein
VTCLEYYSTIIKMLFFDLPAKEKRMTTRGCLPAPRSLVNVSQSLSISESCVDKTHHRYATYPVGFLFFFFSFESRVPCRSKVCANSGGKSHQTRNHSLMSLFVRPSLNDEGMCYILKHHPNHKIVICKSRAKERERERERG